ncbi:hypothetical protein LQZ44_12195 [Alcaligenes nematophilus]|uniref:hypothetical protein n=1 Tax=Alcaligenes nematophilus TaxID=2994643 RepID=UPI0035B549FB
MIEVTKDDFYRAIAGPENIHPTPETNRTVWKDLHAGEVVGRCTQGYVPRRGEPARYYLKNEFAARKGIKERK